MDFRIDTRSAGSTTTVVPCGDIDLETVDLVREVLIAALTDGVVEVVVDLDGVSFIDSTGLGVLVAALRRAHASDRSLVLLCSNERVLGRLRMAGLDRVFTIRATGPAEDGSAPARG